jgi:hypothetical protein
VEKYGRVRQATDDNIIRRMRAGKLRLQTRTWQQRLHERAVILCYTYIGCLVKDIYTRGICEMFCAMLCSVLCI